ncbi:uncharacterized protein (DUF58 family) [Trueperella bonasi]|uniref:Uncharacterized protein (DUF58 family) n=1 Tax=Trueperella bonasi TaxID=312286 RepID=A0ABT9NGI0_9ACTO|nr:DUF58 domain-containing protein [Trueperella bonasi]MDP9806491.1 uncharacterized protein (DUF58 family) [Trueperella bonasi]
MRRLSDQSKATRAALVRAKVALPVIRRASGMYEGHHASIFTGHGHDFEDLVEYEHGDDVADIDWKTSARAGHPIIRRFERESDMFTQLVIDTGRDMLGAAPSGQTKADIAMFAADILGYLAIQRGDRLSVVYGDTRGMVRVPARNGNNHLDFSLDAAQERLDNTSGYCDVSAMLEEILRVPQPRALLLIVTDEYWPQQADEQTLRRIRTKHEVLVMRVADMNVASEGIRHMVDVVDGSAIPRFVREDKILRQDLENDRRRAHQHARVILRSTGVRNATVTSSEEVPGALIELLRRRRAS